MRHISRVTPVVLVIVFAACALSCGVNVDGSPRVVGVGAPVYGRPVSDFVRAELAVAAAARAVEPCGLLDAAGVASLGVITAYGPAGDLSTCHAEVIPPGGTPVDPSWIEVVVGEREPSEGVGRGPAASGIEVRPALSPLPGTCTLYFSLPPVPGVAAPARWGHVSYLDGAAGVVRPAAGDDCAEASAVLAAVTARLHAAPRGTTNIPLAQQDPCRVVENVTEPEIATFAPGSRPYECRLTLGRGDEASVRFALSTPPPRTGGPEVVEIDGESFAFFEDALECHYYFYPGDVVDTNVPHSPMSEIVRRGNRLTASVAATARDCEDAQMLVLAAAEMFDY
ncbi:MULTISPECIES: hypothetical protein [Rhodococcus]|uniref:DUF3558 domain-containing protein n=1 Tax=Rhodococcus oxybenzonivorans TaxID=1990687 RepID=A0AAE4UZK5_9NOCA|nr:MULTISPECIES: hypothetical protein [Rhodococcus]MDV7242859.1 hypothetical protein [Rhodococcus oxybenzonivorans]MDV7265542.1 hypothetical protein [Rhodococcus oxybenzonivorans]MDV7275263.1 hypothetical protein [Rhodococcus oxybenzonivorans]MDV7334882.1 hypothetical protein [Rhodococcus oxybenzonivorans]MDV7345036.1 hypothetical protein [Rhodococcus oxybenzonivorans]